MENIADDTLELSRHVWELYTQYAGRNLSVENKQYFLNAISAQENAIGCFKQSNIHGYFDNMAFAYNKYKKIECP